MTIDELPLAGDDAVTGVAGHPCQSPHCTADEVLGFTGRVVVVELVGFTGRVVVVELVGLTGRVVVVELAGFTGIVVVEVIDPIEVLKVEDVQSSQGSKVATDADFVS